MDGFFETVYQLVTQIPAGKVASYGQIAKVIGHPRSARMVGWAMRAAPPGLPWHRVVKQNGTLAPGLAVEQQFRLIDEGVSFTLDGRVDMKKHQW